MSLVLFQIKVCTQISNGKVSFEMVYLLPQFTLYYNLIPSETSLPPTYQNTITQSQIGAPCPINEILLWKHSRFSHMSKTSSDKQCKSRSEEQSDKGLHSFVCTILFRYPLSAWHSTRMIPAIFLASNPDEL